MVIAALTLHVLALATPIFFQLMIDRVVVHRVQATMTVLIIGVVLRDRCSMPRSATRAA